MNEEYEKWIFTFGGDDSAEWSSGDMEQAYEAGQKAGLLQAVEIGEKRKLAVKPYFETMVAIRKAAEEVEKK